MSSIGLNSGVYAGLYFNIIFSVSAYDFTINAWWILALSCINILFLNISLFVLRKSKYIVALTDSFIILELLIAANNVYLSLLCLCLISLLISLPFLE